MTVLILGVFEDAEKAVAAFGELREEYAAYKKDCADVERVQPTIERAEKYLDLCDAIISSATKQDAFSKRDMGQFLAVMVRCRLCGNIYTLRLVSPWDVI